ncbi:glycoside hydrolase family 127 protein [Pontiella sulfatireligans]|uniref:Non-reducing end beta-L-arabinofuranosidase n=1 Tax=Pontiella sulfatireligans TaxID=2750658 RepID=A0A6C2UP63_9BACT|nr:beta-L-arabinofuranosidase domain-containing protein [Pontiella sulfatireligans]VGO21733.1 Non-reducing end beta-L-arabinofuranosidase [Pontiella sulfatireligans]
MMKHQTPAITDNAASPYMKLKSIGMGDCRWTEGFWADKFKQCEEVMVPYMGSLLKGDVGHGFNNFKIAAGLMDGEHQGFEWHDGDFFKWMEACSHVYAVNKDQKILDELDEILEVVAQAQEDDGYLHTHIQINGIGHFSNRKYHEMYNCGHLYTSACIHHRVTGKTHFLDIAIKNADLLYALFQPQPASLGRFGFNQSQIMGLTELYRTTRDKRYLELAEIFINNRGKYEVVEDASTEGYPIGDMVQERVPLREETDAAGHAVLALYYYAGAADVAAETGEQALLDALDRLWDSVVNKKMYVTGAVGQAHYGASPRKDTIEEGFIDDYMMPNSTAYNETCANIGNAMFNYRMLGIKGESKYADIMELVLHNSAMVGISADGKNYFYANPLRYINGQREYVADRDNTESPDREPYIECFCCPPNLVRTIAKVSGWVYSLSANGVAVNLYGSNKLETQLLDGSALKLTQQTDYPWNGAVKLTVDECKAEAFEIMLRIPEWAEGAALQVNGADAGVDVAPGTFAKIEREWRAGDVVELDMPMDVNLVEGHPLIEEVRNQVAIKRGPLVYCVESPDLPEGAGILDVYFSGNADLRVEHRPDFLGGVSTINGSVLLRSDAKSGMYRTVKKPEFKLYETQFVPYYVWSNRGTAEMTVFMPVVWEN